MFSKAVPFYEHFYEKQKGSGTSYLSLFRLPNLFRGFLSLVIHHLANVDALIQRGFRAIQNGTVDNLCKSFYDAIIFPCSTSSDNFKMLGGKKENLLKT